MDAFSRTQSLVLTDAAAADLIEAASSPWDIVAAIDPQTVVNVAVLSDAIDMQTYPHIRAVLMLGDMAAETIDFALHEAVTSGGIYQELKALAQLAADAALNDNTQHELEADLEELTATYRYVKARVVTGGAVGGPASVLVYGKRGRTVFDGLRVRCFTADITPTKNDTWATYSASLAALDGPSGTALDALSLPINLPGDRKGVHQEIEIIAGAAAAAENIYGLAVYRLQDTTEVLVGGIRFGAPVSIAAEGDYVSHDVVIALPITLPTGLA